jgi:hypothetical protein
MYLLASKLKPIYLEVAKDFQSEKTEQARGTEVVEDQMRKVQQKLCKSCQGELVLWV